jgi:multidrug efflux pump subunit AcrB
MRTFIRFFAQRHTLANVFTFLMIFLGLGALTVIQRDNFPSVDFEEMTITTRYPGASPEDVELNVTNKIEEELEEVDGIDKISSFSLENISVIHLQLDRDYRDTKKIKTDVRDAVSRVSELPGEVDEDPVVEEITTSTAIPIIEVGLTGNVDYKTLREIARQAEKELRNVAGVASLTKYGYLDREIKVEVSQDAVERWRIPTHEIVEAIKNRNIRATGGSFESYTSEKNIVTLAQFSDPSEVEDVIVHVTDDGTLIRVRDLAVVKDDFEPEKVVSRMNGKPAISFLVFKKESADMIRTVDAIKAFIERNQHRLPEGVSIEYSNDASRLVRNRLSVVAINGVLGLLLVLLVLALFLDLRSAFWVSMGIPVALLGTLFLLPVFGAYMDSIALAAMILVIGIIVDDGIVVAENIWQHREQGMLPLDAAVEGTASVFQPVMTTVLTTALAFAPMFVMSGVMGDFVYVIPLVVVLALAISMVEVTVALPGHLIAGVPNEPGSEHQESLRFMRIQQRFGEFVAGALPLRYWIMAIFALALASAFWYAGRYMQFTLFPTQSADSFYMLVELPSGASLDRTSDKMKDFETLLELLPDGELDSYVTRIGSQGNFNLGENENWALLGVYLTPFATRARNADQIAEELREEVSTILGVTNVTFIIESGGPPVGRPITIRVVGSDDELRNGLATFLVERLNNMDSVKDVDRDDKRGKDQIKLDIDYLRLADAGLTVADIARNVRLAYDGEVVTSVRYGDEDVEFRVILEEEARTTLETLAGLAMQNPAGRFIRLDEVTEFRLEPGPSNFYHFDSDRTIKITGDVVKGVTTPLKATEAAIADIDMDRDWPGMRLVVGGEAEETATSMQSLFLAFIAAAVGIYLLLLLLFNSAFQPLIVMIAIPFGLIGVISAFALHQQALGFLAMLGVVGLTGIVVNDSLILVNLANRMRAHEPNRPYRDIVVEATKSRMRPIVLTSITTVAGLLPMAYGIGGSDPFSAPMALAMGYGILFATPLTLLLLPCMMTALHDGEALSSRVVKWLGRG